MKEKQQIDNVYNDKENESNHISAIQSYHLINNDDESIVHILHRIPYHYHLHSKVDHIQHINGSVLLSSNNYDNSLCGTTNLLDFHAYHTSYNQNRIHIPTMIDCFHLSISNKLCGKHDHIDYKNILHLHLLTDLLTIIHILHKSYNLYNANHASPSIQFHSNLHRIHDKPHHNHHRITFDLDLPRIHNSHMLPLQSYNHIEEIHALSHYPIQLQNREEPMDLEVPIYFHLL